MTQRRKPHLVGLLPSDLFTSIFNLAISRKFMQFNKQATQLLVVLAMLNKEACTIAHAICSNWFDKLPNSVHLDKFFGWSREQPVYDLFTYKHIMTHSCVICKQRCASRPTSNRLFMFCHDKCLDNISETVYYMDYRKLHIRSVNQRLDEAIQALVWYHKLTPDVIERHIPYVHRRGLNHNYTRVVLYTHPRVKCLRAHQTLFGYFGVGDEQIHDLLVLYRNCKENRNITSYMCYR